jgi:valyl-tRNA synthetase
LRQTDDIPADPGRAPTEMDKRFEPKAYEPKWQGFWRERDLFRCATRRETDKPSFCILIPPPNVTGRLHMGHALQSSLQDLIVRWKRMQGFNALWLPGTDHAGIGTQLMVERQLGSEGTSRQAIGRERFLERTWAWKQQYHSNIREQLERLGASCDWSRERFTMDEGLSLAVRTAFVRLYREGRIHRGEYMVNWSPGLQTAISDLEVETKSVRGKLYRIAYPLDDGAGGSGSGEKVVVATTRPETMLGDTALAVHPDDPRYRHLVGRHAVLPLQGRGIPIVADAAIDPEFGTGAVKITPWHDPADFEIAQRHGLPGVRVIGFDGRMTADAGPRFAGLDRFAARERVLEELRELDLLVGVEDHVHNVGHSQRGGEPIEPMVSKQWFCDVGAMAQQALAAVRDGRLELQPDGWVKTWEHWLENIRPWCVSRQLWWGHRIPAWYTPGGECVVAMDLEEAAALAGTRELEQDADVLDTWFSSALWPISTLGWPDEESEDLATFYPTDVLVTGFDILFFWVARMAMMGLHFAGDVPFRRVHLTGLVRDARGEKMSKTKGNVLDPLELVDEYGADAVRFTLCALDSPGRDIPLDPERMAGYRAFGNKIWNATRFALARIGDARVPERLDPDGLAAPERWILSRLSRTAGFVGERFEGFRFDEACQRLYHFFWGDLCDWYIELAKPALLGEASRPRVAEVLLFVLERSLRLLHPVMPHLTEELWHRLPGVDRLGWVAVALARYPEPEAAWQDELLERRVAALQEVVSRVRAVRTERGLERRARMALWVEGGAPDEVTFVLEHQELVRSLGLLATVRQGLAPGGAVRDRVGGVEIAIEVETAPLGEGERERLGKELEKVALEISAVRARLANAQFVERAPAAVVDGARARLEELEQRRTVLAGQLHGDGSA